MNSLGISGISKTVSLSCTTIRILIFKPRRRTLNKEQKNKNCRLELYETKFSKKNHAIWLLKVHNQERRRFYGNS